jgi:hypothetical protein
MRKKNLRIRKRPIESTGNIETEIVQNIEEAETRANEINKETPPEPDEPPVTRTRSGQTINGPRRFVQELGAGTFKSLTMANKMHYQHLDEMGCAFMGLVGASIRGGFKTCTNYMS